MRIIREHALERFWLERRLELLDACDTMAEDIFWSDDPEDIRKLDERRAHLLLRLFT